MMEQGPTEKKIFQDHLKYGMPLPEALLNAPFLFDGNDFFYSAFMHLSTCRVSNMAIGNITYFMCVEYCKENDIIGDSRQDFIDIMLAVDDWYIKYCNEKQEKKAKSKRKKKQPENEDEE